MTPGRRGKLPQVRMLGRQNSYQLLLGERWDFPLCDMTDTQVVLPTGEVRIQKKDLILLRHIDHTKREL